MRNCADASVSRIIPAAFATFSSTPVTRLPRPRLLLGEQPELLEDRELVPVLT
jgi:hypothetical protein